eukprot:1029563-Prymnesium_polylepis.1
MHERGMSGQRGLIQSYPSCSARVRRAHRIAAKRSVWCVDRRLSCSTDTRHDVSAGCSCCGR